MKNITTLEELETALNAVLRDKYADMLALEEDINIACSVIEGIMITVKAVGIDKLPENFLEIAAKGI